MLRLFFLQILTLTLQLQSLINKSSDPGMSLNCLESKDMINSFKVTYHDSARNANLCSFGAKQADVVGHAIRAKNGTSFIFEKHDGTSWVNDPDANTLYHSRQRHVKTNGKGPETEFAATLSSLASLSTVLAKIAARTRLTGEQKSELVLVLRECANSSALSDYLAPPTSATTPIKATVKN